MPLLYGRSCGWAVSAGSLVPLYLQQSVVCVLTDPGCHEGLLGVALALLVTFVAMR